ncbi:MAG TPA: glycosyltransferase family 2 protein [bacterium]|nr:glycosyltransferase family 2 protein [bacterium]
METKLPISIMIMAKDEEIDIADCLKSVSWADEVIVLDDFSADRTAEIARGLGARVIQRKLDIEGRHRNFGYAQAKNDWVMSLDCDERVTPELAQEIRDTFAKPISHNGFTIPFKTYIGDYWVRYGGWYPAGKVRIFKRDEFKYEETEVHPRAFMDGTCGHLTKDIIHRSYRDLHDFVQKLNAQTTLEARKWFKENRKIGLAKTMRKFFDRFLRAYVKKKGYKDGFYGFILAYFGGLYQIMSYAKYWEMKRSAGQPPVKS